MFHLHHTKIIHSGVIDWIKPITLKNNFQLFGATECVLMDFLKYAIVVGC
jgi:hypothetical protein